MDATSRRAELLRCLEDEVHVWLSRPGEVDDPERIAACRAMLSEEEHRRYRRFRFERDRRAFLLAHALVRCALSHYVDVAPARWNFASGRRGRPEIAGPTGIPALRFNLAHTRGLVACAVALDADCGVDVEALGRPGDPMRLARRVLSAKEFANLAAEPPERRAARFLEYWTLKEAYVKARGTGLSLPLRGFSFLLERSDRIRVEFDGSFDDAPATWQFALARPSSRHVLGVALRRGDGPERKFVLREAAPGEGSGTSKGEGGDDDAGKIRGERNPAAGPHFGPRSAR